MASKSNSLLLAVLFTLTPALALERFEAVEPHMGSMVRIVVYAKNARHARRAFHATFARITELDAKLSDYQPDSELNRLCASRSMAVSADLFRVLAASQQLAQESDGAFDITAGPLIRLWREARKTRAIPQFLDTTHTGWRKLKLGGRNTATLTEANMRLDLGGIAKGFVADEAIKTLKHHAIASALVAASGDIVVSNPPPGKHGWNVTLELLGGTRELTLSNEAVSTAGDTEQFVEINGTRYSHIIDPRTGMALTTRIAVSVVAPTGLEADGLDTTISVLGPVRGVELMKHHPRAWALIVTEQGAVEAGRSR